MDVTELVKPGTKQQLELTLPSVSAAWESRAGAIGAGGDLATLTGVSVRDARDACAAKNACAGLTFKRPSDVATCADAVAKPGVRVTAYLKLTTAGNGDKEWCTVVAPPRLVGVFFANVETSYTNELVPDVVEDTARVMGD